MRPPSDCHVHVRGTMVSTQRLWPSSLPVSVVQSWGMPNAQGVILCEGMIITLTFNKDDQTVRAWAKPSDESECVLL